MTKNENGTTWDLSAYFETFNGPDMQAFKHELDIDVRQLIDRAETSGRLDTETFENWESLILAAEKISSRLGHLSSYIGCLEAAHADDEAYAIERAALVNTYAMYEKFEVQLMQAFKRASRKLLVRFNRRDELAPVAHYLSRLQHLARHTMSIREEILASDLNVDGLNAWGRLYDRVSGKLVFEYRNPEGKVEQRPISQWRALMSDPDRSIGRAAFEGGNRAWQQIEDVCAAAVNAIAGTRLSLYRHRNIDHFLDRALFQAAISKDTLAAMHQALFERIDLARRILETKAGFFNRDKIWFYEREAPLPLAQTAAYSWSQAVAMITDAFGSAYPRLADYFKNILADRWIESEARPAKRPGAFCTGSSWINEERVYMTFNGSLGDVTTLAHEVGHAWHGQLMRRMRPFARRYPMTLAETASTFAEQILMEGLKSNPTISDAEKLSLLDTELTDAAVFLLDITTRFEFEKRFYELRQQGEVPVSGLKELMVATQRRIYGDVLAADGVDPMFWASKLHFYITGVTFYNFPYTFGYLLARALIGRLQQQGPEFIGQYEDFLRFSGSGSVEKVTSDTLSVDVTDPGFWGAAIDGLAAPLELYRRQIAAYIRDH